MFNILNKFVPKKANLDFNNDILVFSHLRWEFVTQRPQHLLSRFGKNRRIVYVEEPIKYDSKSKGKFNIIQVSENVTVLQPCISWHNMIKELAPMLQNYLSQHNINTPILWFYSPAFVDIYSLIDHSLTIYDCMDQLTAFKGAPASLINQEKRLLFIADIVFTGGKSLYEEKKKYHDNVFCFPSSVDREHFQKASLGETKIPEDILNLNRPIVGFYGVIDERFDVELLDQIATRMSHVSFVIIGPVVKIDEDGLPKRNNIKYFGNRKYDDLPNYLKAIDIAMMPFALNKSTRFISPTKTLEFMSALKPIISTPIFDVVRDYSNEVSIVTGVDEFEQAINYYLAETSVQKYKREMLQTKVVDSTSWNKTVGLMQSIINNELIKPLNNTKALPVPLPVVASHSKLTVN